MVTKSWVPLALSQGLRSRRPCKKAYLHKSVFHHQPASEPHMPEFLVSLSPSLQGHQKSHPLQLSQSGRAYYMAKDTPWGWPQVWDFPSQEQWMNNATVTGVVPCLAGIVQALYLPGAVPTPWKQANPQTHMPFLCSQPSATHPTLQLPGTMHTLP